MVSVTVKAKFQENMNWKASKATFFAMSWRSIFKVKKNILISNYGLSLQDIGHGANAFPFK